MYISAKFYFRNPGMTILHNEQLPDHESPPQGTPTQKVDISGLVLPLYQSLFWMRLFAVCLIVYGALITVTGVGVLVAWLPMWIGVILLLTGKSITVAYKGNNEQAFVQSISRLKTIFITLGISSVALVIASIYLIMYAIEQSLF